MPPLNTIPTTVSPVSGCGSTPAFTTDEAIVPLSRSVDNTTSPWSPAISRRKSSISATPLIQPQRHSPPAGGLAARFLLLSPGRRRADRLSARFLLLSAMGGDASLAVWPTGADLLTLWATPPNRGATWGAKIPRGYPARASLVARAQGRSSRRWGLPVPGLALAAAPDSSRRPARRRASGIAPLAGAGWPPRRWSGRGPRSSGRGPRLSSGRAARRSSPRGPRRRSPG